MIKSSLFKVYFLKLENLAMKEKMFCVLFVISWFTAK